VTPAARAPAICVFCASSERVQPAHLRLAAEVGAEVGRRGWTLVTGGGSVSMMGAVARSARAGGATTVGVIPRALVDMEVADHEADELLVTEDMRQRKGVMDARSDGFLALAGGIGTLEELLEVWVARSLGMHRKPVVVLDPTGIFGHLRAQVAELVERGFVRQGAAGEVRWTTTTQEAFDALAAGLGAAAGARPAGVGPEPAEYLEAQP
jgi:uncharacterized protein (TIGR00730 family)